MKEFTGLMDGVEVLLKEERKGLVLFPITVLLIATITHETSHMIVLSYYNCPFETQIGLFSEGIEFMIKPLCDLTKTRAVVVLSSGFVSNIFLGIVSFLVSSWFRMKRDFIKSFYATTIALGFLFSAGFYFFRETGDIINIIKILELDIPRFWVSSIGFLIISMSTIKFWLQFEEIEKDYQTLHALKQCEMSK